MRCSSVELGVARCSCGGAEGLVGTSLILAPMGKRLCLMGTSLMFAAMVGCWGS